MIGRTIAGRYRLTRLLRAGGMGVVCEAWDEVTAGPVAVKLIQVPPSWGRGGAADAAAKDPSREALVRFHREARAAAAADTEHIVRVLETGVDEESGAPFMAMDLLAGEDLAHVLKELGPLPPDLALRIAAQACLGLVRAHEAGVIHRDIKPANLFLAEEPSGEVVVKILDFGIAKVKFADHEAAETTDVTRTGAVLGSPHYMSPEQVRNPRSIDARADLWSLGVVLYRALTGRTPHQHVAAVAQLMLAICNEAPTPAQDHAPWISPRVAAVLHRALQMRPEDRHASARRMLDALGALLPGGWRIQKEMLAPLSAEQRAVVAFRFDPAAARASLPPPSPSSRPAREPSDAPAAASVSTPAPEPAPRPDADAEPREPSDPPGHDERLPVRSAKGAVALLALLGVALLLAIAWWGLSHRSGGASLVARDGGPPPVASAAPPRPSTRDEPPPAVATVAPVATRELTLEPADTQPPATSRPAPRAAPSSSGAAAPATARPGSEVVDPWGP